MKDAAWLEFLKKAMPCLQSMENKILNPTDFFDLEKTANAQSTA